MSKLTKKSKKKGTTKTITKKVTKKAAKSAKSTEKKGSSSVKGHLAKLKEMYKKAESKGKMPEGTWDVRIAEFRITENNGSLRALWICKGLDAGKENTSFFVSCGLDSEQQLGFLKGAFSTLGVDAPRDIMQLEAVANEETVGLDVQVTVTYDNQYTNCNFDKVIGDGADNEAVEETEEVEPEADPEPEEEDENGGYVIDEKVQVEIEGDMYPGKITDLKDGKAHVEFEDGDSADIPVEDLVSLEADSPEEEEETPADKGDGEYVKKDINKMDEDALETIVDKENLDVDVDDFETVKEQRKAVLTALEEEGLLAG